MLQPPTIVLLQKPADVRTKNNIPTKARMHRSTYTHACAHRHAHTAHIRLFVFHRLVHFFVSLLELKCLKNALNMALAKLILTDFDRLKDIEVDEKEVWGSQKHLSAE